MLFKAKNTPRRVLCGAAPAPPTTETTEGEEGLITPELDDELLEDNDDSEEDSVIEDTSEIGGDEEDIGEVIGAVEGSNDDSA